MFDVFLSHNGRDKRAVEELAKRLKEVAQLEPFLDRWHLIPGARWQTELEQALAECPSVAVFLGESGVSPWQHEELQLAIIHAVRTRDEYRVIPVLLPGARPEDVKGFLAQRTWVDFRSGLDDADAFNRLVAGIKGQALEGDAYRLPDEPAPYRGLLPFGREHARFFFGRDSEIQTVRDKLTQHPFVVVVGASGAGKSSLVLGGVLPRLEDAATESGRPLRIQVMTPGDQPLRALANQLATLVPPEARLVTADELTHRLATRTEAFRNAVDTLTAEQPGTFLLVVDQLEELFTHSAQEETSKDVAAFVSTLREAVEKGRDSIRVIATLRADFFERCLGLPVLRALMQDHQVLLGNLGPEALRDAIVRPAQAVGAFLEKGLAGTILKDVLQAPGTQPLLEHALYELWRARQGAWLTLSAYETSGGVSGALQRRAQSCYEALNPEEQEIARQLFLRLTALGEGTSDPDTRRRVARGELYFPGIAPERVEHVLQVLSGPETRLVTADGDTVEVAHEVLIREWPTLRGWLNKNRRELRVHRRLTEAANEWEKRRRDPSYLYTGSRLLESEEHFASSPRPMNQRERDFLEASLSHRDAQKREQDRRKRQEVRLLRLLAVVLAVATAGIFASWQRARQERDKAHSRELTSQALLSVKASPQQSLRLIQEAWNIDPNADIAGALSAWSREPGLAVFDHSASVFSAAFSPDGSRILTASHDRTVRIWDAATGAPLVTLPTYIDYLDMLMAAGFSPDGSGILTASSNGTATLWDSTSGVALATFYGHSDALRAISFSPDGSRIITASQDRTARIWDAATGRRVAILRGHSDAVVVAGFGPDGSRILTASYDGTARIWDALSGTPLITLSGHNGLIFAADFSPDGSRILTASGDKTARVWDAATGNLLATLHGHEGGVTAASFSADGSRVLTASLDGTVRIWDSSTGTFLSSLLIHTERATVRIVAKFSPDGAHILTATSKDGTARLWDTVAGKPISTFSQHSGPINAAAFSPDGTRIITASEDGTARLWVAAPDKASCILDSHSGEVFSAEFSPDGSHVLTASDDHAARIWDANSCKSQALLTGHSDMVRTARFSPDGTRIVTSSNDKTARIWSASTGKIITILQGHDDAVWSAEFSPDSTRVVTTSHDRTARIWDAATGRLLTLITTRSDPDDAIWVARFNPDSTLVITASNDKTARIWDASSGKLLAVLSGHSGQIGTAEFSPDGARVLTSSSGDGTTRLWDTVSGKPLIIISGYLGLTGKAWFSSDGSRIAAISTDGTARVWNAAAGSLIATLSKHSGQVITADFSAGGNRLLTGGVDGTARLWDIASGNPLAILSGHSGFVRAAKFSPDGSRVLTAGRDGTARLWSCWNWAPVSVQLSMASQLEAGRPHTCDAMPGVVLGP
ncbi:TIR domain-containing protein [Pyxidicoccus trucidator]|uniref:nSTAND1 domain-containing NTPase n=1 Tax=Pyxidicoccus trucidator TaxID=2709662 RepID=UPI0013DC5CA5|nr:TIR domain-containing protein [Pyxidicoccus trucidator]